MAVFIESLKCYSGKIKGNKLIALLFSFAEFLFLVILSPTVMSLLSGTDRSLSSSCYTRNIPNGRKLCFRLQILVCLTFLKEMTTQ